jgi:hypothetical protein
VTDLFDWREGAALRDRGMALAEAAQERKAPGWSDRAYAAIDHVAHAQPTVHIDPVRQVFREEPPTHPRAWGAVWTRAIKAGLIEPTGMVSKTTDPRKHGHPCPVYRSLVYNSPAREVAATQR